jgi:hypothetical protein
VITVKDHIFGLAQAQTLTRLVATKYLVHHTRAPPKTSLSFFKLLPGRSSLPTKERKMKMSCPLASACVFFLLAGVLFKPVSAQVGVEVCACFPSVYTFVLRFDQICAETSLPSAGVDSTVCIVNPLISSPTFEDEVPVAVSTIDIIELGTDFAPIAFSIVTGDFRSGDSFQYASALSTPEGVEMLEELGVFPGGLQLNINGRNAADEFITNVWTILFKNECGLFPVISEGDQIGWTKFVSFVPLTAEDRVSKLFLS